MKKILLALLFIPAFLSAQTTDLSKYHDSNRLWEKADDNFDINADSFAVSTDTAQAIRVDVNSNLDSIAVSTDTAQAIRANLNEIYDPPHGGYVFSDSSTVVALTQNNWAKVTGPVGVLYTLDHSMGITMQGDTITIITPGDYEGQVGLSFDGTANDVFHCAIYLNGVVTPWEMHRKTSNNDTGNFGMPFMLQNLVAGDDISLYIRNTGDNDDATLISGQIIIKLTHPD